MMMFGSHASRVRHATLADCDDHTVVQSCAEDFVTSRRSPSGNRSGGTVVGLVADRPDQVRDLVMFLQGVAKGVVRPDQVVVPPTPLLALDHTAVLEVGDDLCCRALGDVDALGDVLQTQIGGGSDREQDVGMVREECPRTLGL